MLSRVADSLYWMSRYIERAENDARILDVNLQLLLDLGGEAALRELAAAAHARGMRVVAWYLPPLRDVTARSRPSLTTRPSPRSAGAAARIPIRIRIRGVVGWARWVLKPTLPRNSAGSTQPTVRPRVSPYASTAV